MSQPAPEQLMKEDIKNIKFKMDGAPTIKQTPVPKTSELDIFTTKEQYLKRLKFFCNL